MVATSFKYYSLKRYYLEQIIMFVHFIAKKAAKKGGAFKALKMLQILNLIILTIFTSMTYLNSQNFCIFNIKPANIQVQKITVYPIINYIAKRPMNMTKSQTITYPSKFTTLSLQNIQAQLDSQINDLLECDKCGNYVKADELKIHIEQLKKELSEKKLSEITQNHKHHQQKLQKDHSAELDQLNDAWTTKIQHFNSQKDILKKQIQSKHLQEIQTAKKELQLQTPTKLKESSECLNYRKIQQQMKKQKKYSEAHQIQQIIAELQIKQKQSFDKQRQAKIQIALRALKNKQKTEHEAFNKKIQSGLKELEQEKQKEVQKLKLKHVNSLKDLISQQEKELLGEKGQIKSRVSLSTYRSPSKILRSSVSKKLI